VRCGDALGSIELESDIETCRPCRLATPLFTRAVSFGPYEGRMRDAIHALKYARIHSVARLLGAMLAQAIGQLAAEAPLEMLVIPVPLHRSKYSERGFNQARLLAAHALDGLRRSHPQWRLTLASSALLRLRATQSQANLTPRLRRQNVRGAFLVAEPQAVMLKHVLVIDDIFTTGSTVRAIAQELALAGAASVWVATLARAGRTLQETNPSIHRGELVESMHSSVNQPSF
jgi:ComF family protein